MKKGDLVEIVSILKTGSWLEYNSLFFYLTVTQVK